MARGIRLSYMPEVRTIRALQELYSFQVEKRVKGSLIYHAARKLWAAVARVGSNGTMTSPKVGQRSCKQFGRLDVL